MELSMYSLVCMGVGMAAAGEAGGASTFFAGWTPHTLIPALTQAAGGILVGRVTRDWARNLDGCGYPLLQCMDFGGCAETLQYASSGH